MNFPGYEIICEIGRGGMATVYRARQVMLDREVALKVLSPTLAAEPANAQRFLQEARMLASLEHPNVVPVYDVGVTPDGAHYFSMQLLENGDFAARIQHGVDEAEVVRVIAAMAGALGYAHARGYVHRDVTPSNILFDAEDQPRLTDFGIARAMALTSRITASGLSVGTSHYMSPEQARGGEVDPRSDIYALGVVCYEALTGHTPFSGEDSFAVAYAHVYEPVPPLPARLARWQPLIDRCMAKDPKDRLQDCQAFIHALQLIAPIVALPVAARRSGEHPATHSPLPVTDAIAAVDAAALVDAPEEPGADDAPPAARPGWLGPMLGLAGVLLVLAGFAGWQHWHRGSDEGPVAEFTPYTVADAVASRADEGVGAERAGPGPAAAPGEIGLHTVIDPVPVLLERAREDIALRRYSTPPGNNALERYELVRRIEPDNAEARAGIEQIVAIYLRLADDYAGDEDVSLWSGYLQRAEELAARFRLDAIVDQVRQRRQQRVAQLGAEAEVAVASWDRARAVLLYERALTLAPDDASLARALAQARRIGQDGFVFRDRGDSGVQGPEMVVARDLAWARAPVTLGQFRHYWLARGSARFASALPTCRDRESAFRGSRKRTFLEPGFAQGEDHPVVCISASMADDYVRWLTRETGRAYRLPSVAELRAIGVGAAADCASGNLRDASYRANFGGRGDVAGCDDGHATTAPVDAFAANRLGLRDTAGNVRQWSEDCAGSACTERPAVGASWASPPGEEPVHAFPVGTGFNTIGFRVVRKVP